MALIAASQMIKLQDKDKMELQVKQRGNLMMRYEITRQVMSHTVSASVKRCLHLCTKITTLRRLNRRKTHHWNFVALGE